MDVNANCAVENDIDFRAIELPVLNMDTDQALPLITNLLTRLDIEALPSFDLKVARLTQTQCACPYHGVEKCNCQMVVLLLYGQGDAPTSLVIHGQDGKTYLSFVDNARQRPETGFKEKISQALARLLVAK